MSERQQDGLGNLDGTKWSAPFYGDGRPLRVHFFCIPAALDAVERGAGIGSLPCSAPSCLCRAFFLPSNAYGAKAQPSPRAHHDEMVDWKFYE